MRPRHAKITPICQKSTVYGRVTDLCDIYRIYSYNERGEFITLEKLSVKRKYKGASKKTRLACISRTVRAQSCSRPSPVFSLLGTSRARVSGTVVVAAVFAQNMEMRYHGSYATAKARPT